jgi:[acyl-carrier-protein] S-malonyltransferase
MKIAALFPGQGSQSVGMGRDLAERWPSAAGVFHEVDEALGTPLSTVCWEGPEETLRLTENTQPALLAHSIAAWRVLAEHGVAVQAVAGHSLGEYSAVVVGNGLDLAAAARTVRLRGQLMQQAVPVGQGAMAAVLGLDDAVVAEVCAEERAASGGVVVAANFNSPGQLVIAGEAAAVASAIDRCKARGARRAVPLPVSAPFHSPLMQPARTGLEPALRGLRWRRLTVPLYRNVDARAVIDAEDVQDGLIRQVDAPVLWTAIIEQMVADGFDTFIEVGAGTVLSGLVRRIASSTRCHAAGTVESVEKVIDEIGTGTRGETS